jgi:CDP-paratose 2-epimerase
VSVVIITGSGGLIGSEAAQYFCQKGFTVAGMDNDMRQYFFGPEASTQWRQESLIQTFPNYRHHTVDIRNDEVVRSIFQGYGKEIKLVIHTAAQPSHDWAAREPLTDFTVNANGTLCLLEATRQICPEAVFIFTSTNKVYGDRPNELPLVEENTRWELDRSHPYSEHGIPETMSIDATKHSLFGASKAAADILVQEYGRYFDMKTACFRGGCLTGPGHSGTQLHGFLSYLMRCTATGAPYEVFGYKAKQVRDNIHSRDLVEAFHQFFLQPRSAEVYNMGGGKHCNCSMLEAIALCEEITGRKLQYTYHQENRIGDHIWWISDISKFQNHYREWKLNYDLRGILMEIYSLNKERWAAN